MLKSINRQQEPCAQLTPEKLERNFTLYWPRLKAMLEYIRKKSHKQVSSELLKKDESRILEAIKQLFLEQKRQISHELPLDLRRVVDEERDLHRGILYLAFILDRMRRISIACQNARNRLLRRTSSPAEDTGSLLFKATH